MTATKASDCNRTLWSQTPDLALAEDGDKVAHADGAGDRYQWFCGRSDFLLCETGSAPSFCVYSVGSAVITQPT